MVKRLALEILLFRSLLKNEKIEIEAPHRLLFRTSTLLWLGAMAFHWSLLVIGVRHLRFFLEPVPSVVVVLTKSRFDLSESFTDPLHQRCHPLDRLGLSLHPAGHLPQVRYISLPSDYFVLLIIAGIALSGVLMRLISR